jgi:hypothetical protein
MKIPDYYKKYQSQSAVSSMSSGETTMTQPDRIFRGNTFTLQIYDDWQDKTIYTIAGPVSDGIQHSIIISLNPDVETDILRDYADWNIATLTGELKGCRLLKQGPITLANGLPAYKAIFCWYPTEELRIYQEQIYVLVGTTGYNLTASFTKKTRKTLGPLVERMMLSFNPVPQTPSPSQSR